MAKNKKPLSRSFLLLLLLLLLVFGVVLYFITFHPSGGGPPPAIQPEAINTNRTPAPPPAINTGAVPLVTFTLPPKKQVAPIELAPETRTPAISPPPPERKPAQTAARAPKPPPQRAYMPPPPPRRAIAADNTQFIVRRKLLAGGQTYTNGIDTINVPARYYIECTGTTDMQNYYFEIDPASYQNLQNGLMYHVAKTEDWKPLGGMPVVEAPPPGYNRVR